MYICKYIRVHICVCVYVSVYEYMSTYSLWRPLVTGVSSRVLTTGLRHRVQTLGS